VCQEGLLLWFSGIVSCLVEDDCLGGTLREVAQEFGVVNFNFSLLGQYGEGDAIDKDGKLTPLNGGRSLQVVNPVLKDPDIGTATGLFIVQGFATGIEIMDQCLQFPKLSLRHLQRLCGEVDLLFNFLLQVLVVESPHGEGRQSG
jgi:hypothetical protein